MLSDTGWGEVWQRARPIALAPAQQASPLARRPPPRRGVARAERGGPRHSGRSERQAGVMEMGGRVGHSGIPLDSLGRVPGTLGALTWATWYARTRGGQNVDLTR